MGAVPQPSHPPDHLPHVAHRSTLEVEAPRLDDRLVPELEDSTQFKAHPHYERTAEFCELYDNPAFDPREIEVERGVILQEIGQSLDTPDDIIFDWLQEAAYPDQPMGRTILGPAERVSSFGRADLAGFVTENYGPGQMVVAAAGSVDHDRIVRLAEKVLGHIVPRRLAESLCHREGASGNLADLSDKVLRRLDQAVNAWAVKPVGSEGYRTAEVTLGGVDTAALDQQTMQAKTVPGLYFIGEAVDVTGWLGGYNFQWAWASGFAAGEAIADGRG